MAGQDTANFDAAMKTVYADGIAELIPNKFKLLEMFEEVAPSKEWGGRYVEQSVHVGRNTGVGAYAEMGAIPEAGQQQYTLKRIPMRYLAARIQLSAQVMRHSQGNRSAFEPAMEAEMRRVANDIRNDMARIIVSDGRGVLAFVNGDPSTGTTITVDSPGGVAGSQNGSRFINPTMRVTFVTPATGAIVGSADEIVGSVPAAGTTFTITSAANTNIADNDYVVKANKSGLTDVSDTSYAKEPMGLRGLNDDGTYVSTLHGVNRTTYPSYQSSVISSVGALSADVLQRGIDLADQRGGGSVDKIVWHPSVRRTYITLSDNGRRYMGGDLSRPDVGTVAAKGRELTFGGIATLTDKYMDYGIVHLLDTSTLFRFVEVKGEWADEDGSVLKQMGTGSSLQDAYEAYYRIWQNFDCDAPNKNARLDGVTATVAVVHAD